MLLAATGQAAPYTYDSAATRKINTASNNVSNVNAGTSTSTPTASNATGSDQAARSTTATGGSSSSIASNAASALMKTLSVRLHRGTEFIKDTVQKALVMSASTPVATTSAQPLEPNHSQNQHQNQSQSLHQRYSHLLMRKNDCSGGGVMTQTFPKVTESETAIMRNRYFSTSPKYFVLTPEYLQRYAKQPTELHRSAAARARNPSTDSLLMDLCLFKPIRPMPITPIKINKARGFELKRPKFSARVAPAYSDDEDDVDSEDLENTQPLQEYKLKASKVKLPLNAESSAFEPHRVLVAKSSISQDIKQVNEVKDASQNEDSCNTKTSANTSNATRATKRRRRAPLLTAKRRRKPTATITTDTKSTKAALVKLTECAKLLSLPPPPPPPYPPPAHIATKAVVRRIKRAAAAPTPAEVAPPKAAKTAPKTRSSRSASPMRKSPPMTRQRARQHISASSHNT